jgi:hypothetical protein
MAKDAQSWALKCIAIMDTVGYTFVFCDANSMAYTDRSSPRRGEVDLLSAMRSIVRCKSGEGPHTKRETLTPARSLSSGAHSSDPLAPTSPNRSRIYPTSIDMMPNSGKPELGGRGEGKSRPIQSIIIML